MGARKVWYNVPHEPLVRRALKRVTRSIEPGEYQGGLYRLIDLRSLSAQIIAELDHRAQQNMLPSGAISLDTELGSLELTVEDRRVSLGAADPVHVRLSQPDFFGLLFGLKPVNEMQVPMTMEAYQIMSALFPRQRSVFWSPDHF